MQRELRSKRRLIAIIKGWRVRKILNRTRDAISLKNEIFELADQQRYFKKEMEHARKIDMQRYQKLAKNLQECRVERR